MVRYILEKVEKCKECPKKLSYDSADPDVCSETSDGQGYMQEIPNKIYGNFPTFCPLVDEKEIRFL
jgi:hypothetical protein